MSNVQKLTAFAAKEAAETARLVGAISQEEAEQARRNYEAVQVPGNANPFVPWDDPNIPYWCDCGEIIYSDFVHEH